MVKPDVVPFWYGNTRHETIFVVLFVSFDAGTMTSGVCVVSPFFAGALSAGRSADVGSSDTHLKSLAWPRFQGRGPG